MKVYIYLKCGNRLVTIVNVQTPMENVVYYWTMLDCLENMTSKKIENEITKVWVNGQLVAWKSTPQSIMLA